MDIPERLYESIWYCNYDFSRCKVGNAIKLRNLELVWFFFTFTTHSGDGSDYEIINGEACNYS